mgnify:CR=1 FL=1
MECSICGTELGVGDCVVDGKPYCKGCYKKQFSIEDIYKLIENKKDVIKDLFSKGYSISRICIELGFYTFVGGKCSRCGSTLVQTLKVGRKSVSNYIREKVLGFKSWDEYYRELKRIQARTK